mgnify:CR=1 FL=1
MRAPERTLRTDDHHRRRGMARDVIRVRADQQMKVGSYANAIGLELGAQAIDPATRQLFVMHNDVLALRDNWLPYLQSKLTGQVRAAAVLHDTARRRIGALLGQLPLGIVD